MAQTPLVYGVLLTYFLSTREPWYNHASSFRLRNVPTSLPRQCTRLVQWGPSLGPIENLPEMKGTQRCILTSPRLSFAQKALSADAKDFSSLIAFDQVQDTKPGHRDLLYQFKIRRELRDRAFGLFHAGLMEAFRVADAYIHS